MKLDIEHNRRRLEKVPLEDVLELKGQVLVIGSNYRALLELFVQEKEIQDKVARIQRAKRRERFSNFTNAAEDSRDWFDLPKSMETQRLAEDNEEQESNNPFEEDHEQGAVGGVIPKPLVVALISRPGDRFSLKPGQRQVQFEFPTAGNHPETTSFEPDLRKTHSSDSETLSVHLPGKLSPQQLSSRLDKIPLEDVIFQLESVDFDITGSRNFLEELRW